MFTGLVGGRQKLASAPVVATGVSRADCTHRTGQDSDSTPLLGGPEEATLWYYSHHHQGCQG
jgi:hypothetical protein